MTLNEVNIIKNSVLDATEAYVDARLNSSDFVKTQIGVTSGDPTEGSDGKYRHVVVCNKTAYTAGVTYRNVLSVGNVKFPANSVVFLIAPNAQYSNQFILGKLDNTPANIVGGTIKIGRIGNTDDYYFSVNETGNVTIKSGSIKLIKDTRFPNADWYHISLDTDGIKLGHQNANSDKYNFSVDQNGNVKIYDGSILLGANGNGYNVDINNTGIGLGYNTSASGNHNFTVDTSGNLKIGNTSTPNFQVTSAGTVTIKSGSILLGATGSHYNVNISSSGFNLGYTSSGYNFSVSSAGVVTIKSGSIDINNQKFYVDTSGNLTAKYITANVGGSIGGWTIDATNGLKSTQSNSGVCTLYPHTIKIAKFGTNKSSGASALLGLDVANERIVVNSDSGKGSFVVSNQTGWTSTGGITNPEQGVYTKISPAAVMLHNSSGSATIGWNGAKFLNRSEDQGIEKLRIYVGSNSIAFTNVDSGNSGYINLT